MTWYVWLGLWLNECNPNPETLKTCLAEVQMCLFFANMPQKLPKRAKMAKLRPTLTFHNDNFVLLLLLTKNVRKWYP